MGLIKTAMVVGGGMYAVKKITNRKSKKDNQHQQQREQSEQNSTQPPPQNNYWSPPPQQGSTWTLNTLPPSAQAGPYAREGYTDRFQLIEGPPKKGSEPWMSGGQGVQNYAYSDRK